MMNVSQDIFNVTKVRAELYFPENANAVTICIETEGGQIAQVLYFGYGVKQSSDAAAFYYALGGLQENVQKKTGV